ncbi:chaperonin 10-like protein [Podospora didyma]|uniref:Chaperonin 10-like protein n=1 Tax=Podospora didyma TaxID=330526 RepID=A0AAE0K2V8_9PEZI|nr:chaperonin 10-like protein [Podospora didyma]
MAPASSAPKKMKQYVAVKQGGPFQLAATADYPVPGPDEICIRNRAVALNPLDWKNLYYGQMVKAWPEVFGIDTSGVVEVVGENVTAFKPGDAVLSLAGHGGRAGAFQDVTVVPQHFASLKPACWTFEEASSVPICYLTAAAAVVKGLGVPLPHLKDTRKEKENGGEEPEPSQPPTPVKASENVAVQKVKAIKCVLVVGGSSGVGACAIQLLRMALPSAIILSTNSAMQNGRVAKLGATTSIDRNLEPPKLVEAIKAASPGGEGVDAILDAVGGAEKNSALFDVLTADGPKLYSQVFTGANIDVPTDVSTSRVYGRMVFETPGGMLSMRKIIELAEQGKFKLPLKVQVVGKGLDAIGAGLERLKEGVSGTKLVVSL